VAFLLDLMDQEAEGAPSLASRKMEELSEVKLAHKIVNDLMNYSKTNEFFPLHHNTTFREVLDVLSTRGVHNVVTLSRHHNHLGRFITQSQIIQLIADNTEQFGEILEERVEKSGIGTNHVITLNQDDTTYSAFRTIIEKRISGVAITDQTGKLVGNLSIKDIRLVVDKCPNLELNTPISEFLKDIQQVDPKLHSRPVTCEPKDAIITVVHILNASKMQSIFIVDYTGRPVGVISLGDVCKYILMNAEPQQKKWSKLHILGHHE